MSKVIQAGLIGFGMGGSVFHAPIITSLPEFKLVKIRESRNENIAIVTARYPEAQIVKDVKEIFEDSRIDLVIIATPNASHLSLAKEALLAGKHVVVEKPFTITSEEADALISISKRQKKLITVHHNRRWDSDFKTVKKVIESQMLGNLVEYEAHFDRFRNMVKQNVWKEENLPGSGILYDLGSHLIDQAQCLFGLPSEITADIRIQRRGGKTPDNFEIILPYENLKVTLKAGMLVRTNVPQFILLGDQGSFVKHRADVQEETLKAGESPLHKIHWGEEPEAMWGTIDTDHNGEHITGKIESERGDYREFYVNVYKAILGEEELQVKPEQARNTIRIIELAMLSSEKKRTVKFVLN